MPHAQDDPAVDADPDALPDDESPPLRLAVVRYDDGPDRATLSPDDPDPDEACTAWLTVDRAVLRSLDEMR